MQHVSNCPIHMKYHTLLPYCTLLRELSVKLKKIRPENLIISKSGLRKIQSIGVNFGRRFNTLPLSNLQLPDNNTWIYLHGISKCLFFSPNPEFFVESGLRIIYNGGFNFGTRFNTFYILRFFFRIPYICSSLRTLESFFTESWKFLFFSPKTSFL